ncbi:MAG: TonB family protein [Bacteroidota bacterium]
MRIIILSFFLQFAFMVANAQSLRPAEKDGLWGFVDNRGKFRIKPIYDEIGTYDWRNRLYAVSQNNKWGFVNMKGKLTIPLQYDDIWKSFDVKGGICAVKKDNKWGFIDKHGATIIDFQFDETGASFNYSDGLCTVKKDDKWGHINRSGKIITPIEYDFVTTFKRGHACGKKGENYESLLPEGGVSFSLACDTMSIIHFEYFLTVIDGRHGVLDSAGKTFIDIIYDDLRPGYEKSFIIKKDGAWGLFENGQPNFEKPEEIIYLEADVRPYFAGCDIAAMTEEEARLCSDEMMLVYIYRRIRYPAIARENGVEGIVVIRFVVDEEGNVIYPEILRDIGAGAGEESLRIVKNMPKWIPGKVDNKPVKTSFNLPVKFKLE